MFTYKCGQYHKRMALVQASHLWIFSPSFVTLFVWLVNEPVASKSEQINIVTVNEGFSALLVFTFNITMVKQKPDRRLPQYPGWVPGWYDKKIKGVMEREIKGEGEGELTVCRHPVRKPKAGNSYPAHPLKAENTHARIHLISYHTFLHSAHSGEKLVCVCPQGAFNI